MNADPRVMEHFPSVLTADESDALVDRIVAGWSAGHGLWAVESRASGSFVGFVGLSSPTWSASFTPCVELGWRLTPAVWGRGLATEGARAAIRWAGEHVSPPRGELVSFTTVANTASRRVMEKLGLRHDPADDFDHPLLPDWSGRRHVLYRAPLGDLVALAGSG
jgi:RimJ/RimL family protein N-acetyltransferase